MVAAWEMISAEALATGWEIYENKSWENDLELIYTVESTNSSTKSLIQEKVLQMII
jgi:hypothetical protein